MNELQTKPGTFKPYAGMPDIDDRIMRAERKVAFLKKIKSGEIPDGPYGPREYLGYVLPALGGVQEYKREDPSEAAIPVPEENVKAHEEEARLREEYDQIQRARFEVQDELALLRTENLWKRERGGAPDNDKAEALEESLSSLTHIAREKEKELQTAMGRVNQLEWALYRKRVDWRQNAEAEADAKANESRSSAGKVTLKAILDRIRPSSRS